MQYNGHCTMHQLKLIHFSYVFKQPLSSGHPSVVDNGNCSCSQMYLMYKILSKAPLKPRLHCTQTGLKPVWPNRFELSKIYFW